MSVMSLCLALCCKVLLLTDFESYEFQHDFLLISFIAQAVDLAVMVPGIVLGCAFRTSVALYKR